MLTEDKETTIYAYLDSKSGVPVYVGKTTMKLKRRANAHDDHARRKPKTPFHKWLARNKAKLLVLDVVKFEDSSQAEVRWIKRLGKRYPLLNVNDYSSGNPGVGRIEWTEELIAQLGRRTDSEIAQELGCCRKAVAYKRETLGIKRFPDPHNTPQTIYLDLVTLARLGTEPDYKIANDVGVSKFVIAKHRKKLGIESYAAATGNDGRIKRGEAHRRWR